MSDDVIKTSGSIGSYKENVGGEVGVSYAVRGVVKNNIDATRSGRLQVYIADFGNPNPDDHVGWVTVSYMSPFYGNTAGSPTQGTGTFTDNPHSYGFWAVPPDLGTEVICIFLNGKKDFGFYIGCIPQHGLTQMVPAIGGVVEHKTSDSEKSKLAGTDDLPLPVIELNRSDKSIFEDPGFHTNDRPVHSSIAAQFWQQGLIRDPVRGPITSSSMRESPSKVFGMSTPGRPIYKGKLTGNSEEEVTKQVSGAKDDELKIIGRRGGHTFVMDDGDMDGFNQLLRLRTSAGHQITMSDDGQTLFVIHANGQSFIELGKEGTIDIFSVNSFNVRSQGDINFHADRNINIHAKKDLNIYAENIKVNSDKETQIRTGTEFKQYTLGDYSVKVAKNMSFASDKPASFLSKSTTFVNGSIINLNTGQSAFQPKDFQPIPQQAHPDTLFDETNGWLPSPGTLPSIANRVPAHTPWVNANKGVDVKVSPSGGEGGSAGPSAPSPSVVTTNASVSPSPSNATSPAIISTTPPVQAVSTSMDKSTTSAVVSQTAVDAGTGPAAKAVADGKGVLDIDGTKQAILGKLGHTPTHLESAGILKPGSASLAESLVNQNTPLEKALSPNMFTGKNGVVDMNSYTQDQRLQVETHVSLMQNSHNQLQSGGIISGNESAGMVAGLVASASLFGIASTTDFVKNSANNIPSGTAISGLSPASGTQSNVSKSISSGNFAANLSEKSTGASGSILSSIKQGASSAITATKGAIGSAIDAVKSGLKKNGTNPSMNNFANGEASINNVVSKSPDMVSASPAAGALAAAVAAVASTGTTVKMPTIAENTFDRTNLDSVTKTMLPDGVQTSPTSMKPVQWKPADPALQTEYNGYKKEVNKLQNERWDLNKKMNNARRDYGPDSDNYKQLEVEYQTNLQKARELRQKMDDVTLKMLGT